MDTTSANTTTHGLQTHQGSCHCGAVRFEVVADLSKGASRCNCTICTKIGGLGIIVKPNDLVVLSDEASANLGSYEWSAKIARRYFCRTCGIHTFSRGHLAEVGGDFAGVNINCLDDIDQAEVKVSFWDGRHDNWMAGTRDRPWPIFAAPAAVAA